MRRLAALCALGIVLLVPAREATATPALVTIDDTKPKLTKAGGETSGMVAVRNLTQESLTVSAAPTNGGAKCRVEPSDKAIPASTMQDVALTVSSCDIPEDGLKFALTVTGSKGETQSIDLTAAKPAAEADWTPMKAFPVALVILGLATWAGYLLWRHDTRIPGANPTDQTVKPNLSTPLSELGSTWKFSDSWASNVTLAGGLLTGVVGTAGPVKALLGADADNAIGVSVVGAAVAVVLVGAGSIAAQALKDGTKDVFTVGSLLVGAVLTMSGALGQVYVTAVGGGALQNGRWKAEVLTGAVLVAGLLLLYAFHSLRSTLDRGVDDGVPAADPEAVVAAKLVIAARAAAASLPPADQVGAIRAAENAVKAASTLAPGATPEEIAATAGAIQDYPLDSLLAPMGPGDSPLPRRRAVMI